MLCMLVHAFTHSLESGWSVDSFPDIDSSNTLVMVFGASDYWDAPEALEALDQAFPEAIKIGCSTAGEIFGASITDSSLVVSVVKFERTQLRFAISPVRIESSYHACDALAEQLLSDDSDAAMASDLKAVFLLSDGLQVNGSVLVQSLSEKLGDAVSMSGGLAGDGSRFERTWTWSGGKPMRGMVVAVGFYGDDVEFNHGSYGGWNTFGPERLITRASSSTLYELDGQPALDLYKHYLGEYAKDLPSSGLLFPLAIRSNRDDEEQTVRTILAVDEAKKAIVFAGSMPEGHYAQLMTANFDQLIDGANKAANQLIEVMEHGRPGILIGISCVGRRLLLGERAEEELEAVLEAMPQQQPVFIGFHSYGEISPNMTNVHCSLKNQTMTLTWLSER